MKKCITLGFALAILLLAGCATPGVTTWEYKVVYSGIVASGDPKIWEPKYQEFLNNFGKEGWMLVSQDNGVFYFKRPIR